jgi:hypothetical protein
MSNACGNNLTPAAVNLCVEDQASAALLRTQVLSDMGQAFCGGRLPMGLGALGDGNLIFKRKFRWTFEIQFCCNQPTPQTVAREFVKVGNRPQIDIEEVEINYLNAKTWIPGKGTWQTLGITYYDVSGTVPTMSGGSTTSILGWIATIYDFTNPCCLTMNSTPAAYEGLARLILWDGCGAPLEGWILRHVWPTSVNWGDLDMSSSEECTIELTLRFSEVSYQSYCPNQSLTVCPCVPCS